MKKYIPYIIILAAVFNLTPLLAHLAPAKGGIGFFIVLLFFIYPLASFLCPLLCGRENGFCPWFIIVTPILLLPATFIYFNSSACVYMISYTLLTFIGLLLGALIHKKRNGKHQQGL